MQTHTRPGQGRQRQNPFFSRRYRHSAVGQSGAALIIALAILMVLLSLAITFILIVRFESNIARQTFDRTRAEHLLDGALAQAEYRLNRDLEVHPDAVSLDHGWRSWFSGEAFVGKTWTRAFQWPANRTPDNTTKSGASLYNKGLVAVNIESVESAMRAVLNGGMLYVQFLKDWHTEPVFRGPRTEHWLHVPRDQQNMILLFTSDAESRLVNNVGAVLTLADLNDALAAAGRAERFDVINESTIAASKSNPNYYPFVTPAFMNAKTTAPETEGLLPQEQVNLWADVDSDGDGMRDAIWMPLARDINHHGDGIDNDLDGTPDPLNSEGLLFESAPFVYHGLGLPQAVKDEDPDVLATIRLFAWNDFVGRWQEDNPLLGDGFDNDNNGIIDLLEPSAGDPLANVPDPAENRLFLTVPLPGLLTQVDVSGDGVFNEKDWYVDVANNFQGPLFVRLPDTLFVPVIEGQNADGTDIINRVPVTIANVDVLDNDDDLIVNNFRAYAYIGAVKPGFHDINLDAILETGRVANLAFYCVTQNGTTQTVSYASVENYFLNDAAPADRRDINLLHLSCSGEPVSEIVGRYAVNITDEAGKVNLNAGGGYTEALDGTIQRAENDGATSFEYETRLVPTLGTLRSRGVWGMRTGFDERSYDVAWDADFFNDGNMPGYGFVDDNGNALLLSMSGRDLNGDGQVDDGLFAPKLSLNADTEANIADYAAAVATDTAIDLNDLFNGDVSPLGRIEFNRFYNASLRLGRFQGIDEPAELRLFNPLRNDIAEAVLGEPGRYSDRLLLRKEYLQRLKDIDKRWDYSLRNLVTVNSDMRNTYAVQGYGLQQAFLRVDPNYATPQQLATALLVRGDTNNILDGPVFSGINVNALRFAEGLRQFDTAFTGDIMGSYRNLDTTNRYLPGMRFPADPVLQTLRLATEAVAGRDRSQGRRKLVTENLIAAPDAYLEYLKNYNLANGGILTTGFTLPLEVFNERERIPDADLMPTGAVQEYLYANLGMTDTDTRLITPDLWWKYLTQDTTNNVPGEDRLFQYATASLDAIRINELMVRPVRRVEAETLPLYRADGTTLLQGTYETDQAFWPAEYAVNLDPAPYQGMPVFDMLRFGVYDVHLPDVVSPANQTTDVFAGVTPMDSGIPSYWSLRSAYDSISSSAIQPQPLLGDRTAFVLNMPAGDLADENYIPALDILEFEFASPADDPASLDPVNGLPEGRYYLTVNVTDQYGNMTVLEPDVLQYTVKYRKGSGHNGIVQDVAALYDPNEPTYSLDAVNALFQNVDQPEYLATPAARQMGSAAPAGWVFLPNTELEWDGFEYALSGRYGDFNATIGDFAAWSARETPDPTNPTLEEYLIADGLPTSDPDGDSVLNVILGIDTTADEVSWYNIDFQQAVVNWFLTQGFPLPTDVGYTLPVTNLTELYDYQLWLNTNGIAYTLDADAQLLYDELLTYEAQFGIIRDYFNDGILKANYPASRNGRRTFTVIVPRASSGYHLCVGLRLAPVIREAFVEALEAWIEDYNAWGGLQADFPTPPPAYTYPEYLAFWERLAKNEEDGGASATLPDFVSYLPPKLAVNFFDFSQEPDHEYLELANTSDEEVDVGGWRLEVGVPGPVGIEQNSTIQDPYKSVWRIPDDTKVAAGGYLLLGFDQTDEYRRGDTNNDTESYLVATNGMGLATDNSDDLTGITVPPMADESPRINPTNPGVSWYAPLNDLTGSVFQRNDGYDYVDNDGDGLSSAYYFQTTDTTFNDTFLPNFVSIILPDLPDFLDPSYTDSDLFARARYEVLDTDHYYEEYKTHSENTDGTIPAWSRIVQLENEYLWLENGRYDPPLYPEKYDPIGSDTVSIRMQDIDNSQRGLARLARLVLRGGVLPNYPEHDGIDNDGDGGYVIKNPTGGVTRFTNSNYNELHDTWEANGSEGEEPESYFDEPVMQYVAGTLDKDMIDNNLDYILDKRGNEIYNVDDGVFARHGNPLLSEGVDEGQLGVPIYFYDGEVDTSGNLIPVPSGFTGFMTPYDDTMTLPISLGPPRFYGHGSYESMPLPLFNVSGSYSTQYREKWIRPVFVNNGNPPYLYTDSDGVYAFDDDGVQVSARPEYGFNPFINTGSYLLAVNNNPFPGFAATDSPDWQAFVERRWNPGDNVVVTLYVGHPDLNRVADQVTYRENDVINRTLDDIMPSPYAVDGFSNYGYDGVAVNASGAQQPVWLGVDDGTVGSDVDRACLHPPGVGTNDPGKPTFWLPDHMGLDFYRSLERKHPLYHGDRFGTANRWTVTDGAYDDWADSMSLFESGLGSYFADTFDLPGSVGFIDNTSGEQFTQELRVVYPRFRDLLDTDLTTLNAYERSERQLFGHAMWGSPLRMNTQARVWENPPDLADLALDLDSGHATGLGNGLHYEHNYDRRLGRQFPGLDVYRNTGHKLIQRQADLAESGLGNGYAERRDAVDWALRRANTNKRLYTAPADLADLPFLSFEKVLDGPYYYAQTSGRFFPRYAVSPLNTRYYGRENDVQTILSNTVSATSELRRLSATENILRFSYGYDPDLTSVLASQAVPGGGTSVMRDSFTDIDDPALASAAMEVSAMNPIVLTVGQARVVPLWPAPPDALNPNTGSAFTDDEHRQFFKWQLDGPPHNWTPVYLLNLPMPSGASYTAELPWLRVNYPRRIYAGANPPVIHSIAGDIDDPLVEPVYLFNGYYYAAQYFPSMAEDIRGGTTSDVNDMLAQTIWPRWPVRVVASVIASDYEQRAPSDRAVLYVSKYNSDLGGEQNRPEALFVWDKDAGLENGTYIAYVGTFIPGLAERMADAESMALQAQQGYTTDKQIPLLSTGARTAKLLGLDPTRPEILSQSSATPRFDPHLAFEFMTDRRDAEQMRDYGVARDAIAGVYGMTHPGEWGKEGDPGLNNVSRGQVETADKEGYLLYSSGSGIAWQPIPVRVTDNFLALRVRNTGSPSQVACVSHVVLAPAPRTRGVVNINTAETHRVIVSGWGGDAKNWTVELFNALIGLPGITNALNPEGNRNYPPYLDESMGMPQAAFPKNDSTGKTIDPWRQRWTTDEERDMLHAVWNTATAQPPYQAPSLNYDATPRDYDLTKGDFMPLVTENELDNYPLSDWNNALHGRVMLRMAALLAEGRVDHPDGRYYSAPEELLGGIGTGGIARPDATFGPWPLSNLGVLRESSFQSGFAQGNKLELHEKRYEEIMERFRRMSNMITTRSDVFEIIATVQSGSISDLNEDGVLDYRGDEFFPQAERRARIIYDRRARAVRQDEKRE